MLNPNNTGVYVGGISYFPHKPYFLRKEVKEPTEKIDSVMRVIHPSNEGNAVPVTIDQIIELVSYTKSHPRGGGLWDDARIIFALEHLKSEARYDGRGYLVARRGRNLGAGKGRTEGIRSFFGGSGSAGPGDAALAERGYPTLFMYRVTGKGWDNEEFWIPNLRFPDGGYAFTFNFD